MAESTAGIGEAGALVNRAKAPATLDITRGMQMAENSALKKAQLEAAKAAKTQALQDRMLKFSEVTPPDMKNAGMARKAQKIGLEASSKLYQAAQTGSPQAVFMAKSEIAKDMNLAKIQDNIVSDLKSDKKYKYVNDIGNLLDDDKLDEVNKLNKPYAPVYAINERGDYKILAPDKIDLNKKYSSVIKDAGKNLIQYKDDADRVAGTDNYLLSRQMTKGEIDVATSVFLKDPDNYAGTLYSPDFQKFYDENPKYKGSTEEQKIASGIVEYTKNRIEELNMQKLSPKASKTGSNNYELTGDGYNLGKYSFTILNVPPSELVEKFKQGKDETMYGKNRKESATFMDFLSRQPISNGVKVSMPANETKTFILDDPKVGNSIEGIPLSIYAGGGKQTGYLIYKDKNTDVNQIVPLNSELVARLASYYKVSSQDFINANKRKGVDLTKYTPDGSVNIKKGGNTPPTAKASTPKKDNNNFIGVPPEGF
jgi:hypothetical protein